MAIIRLLADRFEDLRQGSGHFARDRLVRIFDRLNHVAQRIRHAHDGRVCARDALLRFKDCILDQAQRLVPVGEAFGYGFADRLQLRIEVRQRAAHRFRQFLYHHFHRVTEAFDCLLDQVLFILAVGEAVLYSLLDQFQVCVEACLLVRQRLCNLS